MVRRELPLELRNSDDGLAVAVGPLGTMVIDMLRLAWNPLRLWRLRVRVELPPGLTVTVLIVVERLKSATSIINCVVCETVPSVAVTMIV